MSLYRAALFDLDGVLADSAVLHYAAWKRLADELGVPFDQHANERLKGVDRLGSLRLILGGRAASDADLHAWAERKNETYRALIATVTPADVLPGVAALLDAARAAGLRLAVASASRNAPELLARLGLADAFDFVADAGAVVQPKPAPDIFLACARELDVAPARCIGFEDAAAGVDAILAAGMLAVGIGDPAVLHRARLVFPSTAAVDLSMVLAEASPSGVA